MEQNFATIFEDVSHERSSFFIISLSNPDILKQSKFTEHERNIIKNIALDILHRQRMVKQYTALLLLKEYFLLNKWPILI